MEKQMELNAIPPRQRVRLVEGGPSEGAKSVEVLASDLTGPIGVFPGLILDARYLAGMKTEWFDPRTHVPKSSGFYEILPANGYGQMAWYEAPEQAFYTCSGTVHNTTNSNPNLVWRGAVEALGRRRRSLVD